LPPRPEGACGQVIDIHAAWAYRSRRFAWPPSGSHDRPGFAVIGEGFQCFLGHRVHSEWGGQRRDVDGVEPEALALVVKQLGGFSSLGWHCFLLVNCSLHRWTETADYFLAREDDQAASRTSNMMPTSVQSQIPPPTSHSIHLPGMVHS